MRCFYKVFSCLLIFTLVSCYSKRRTPAGDESSGGTTPDSQSAPMTPPLNNSGNNSDSTSDDTSHPNSDNPTSTNPLSNTVDAFGNTALHIAAQKGDLAQARSLIQQGADVNALNARQLTPLHIAITKNNLEMTQFLVENGAQVTDRIIEFASNTEASQNIIQVLENSRSSAS